VNPPAHGSRPLERARRVIGSLWTTWIAEVHDLLDIWPEWSGVCDPLKQRRRTKAGAHDDGIGFHRCSIRQSHAPAGSHAFYRGNGCREHRAAGSLKSFLSAASAASRR
jgi:hypothetical protein